MRTITSKDGTTIAFDQYGLGPALILIGGMFEQRALDTETAQLAVLPLMKQHFTVYHYDRRGRGASSDTQPYAVEREIEDIQALIDDAGDRRSCSVCPLGQRWPSRRRSALGDRVKKLAMYEAPYNDDAAARQAWRDFRKNLRMRFLANHKDQAVALFMTLLGVPADHIPEMHQYPHVANVGSAGAHHGL